MNIPPDVASELNRKRIKEELDAIRLQEEATKGEGLLNKNLAVLGDLLVSGGEKLRKRYKSSSEESSSGKLVNKAA